MNYDEEILAGVQWRETGSQPEGDLPYATHEGMFEILGSKLRCYRLNTGQAIIHGDDLAAFLQIPDADPETVDGKGLEKAA